MAKSIEESFVDWESHVFGFGYGTGEPYTLGALKAFFAAIGDKRGPHCYDYLRLEEAVSPTTCWLLMAVLCRANIIEYGTSPRYGWLTNEGKALQMFLAKRTVEQLVEIVTGYNDPIYCSPTICNCGPHGYEEGRKCINPFWH